MPRKRSVQEIAQSDAEKKKTAAGRSTPRSKQTGARRRSTAATAAGGVKPRKGTTRASAAAIAARNAQIVRLREINRWMWEQIATHFGIDEKTARSGYDSHIAAREHEVNFERAMRDMREYATVLIRNQQALAKIAHELDDDDEAAVEPQPVPEAKEGEPVKLASKVGVDTRTRILAMHEMVEQMFKEIAIRQAIGDLPVRFEEMAAAKDLEWSIEQIMAILQKHKVPRKVFLEIAERLDESDVSIPKTHLSSVGT